MLQIKLKFKLAEFLEDNNISKNDFARLMDIQKFGAVRRYFKPNYDPHLSSLARFAVALGCSIEDLVDYKPLSKKSAKKQASPAAKPRKNSSPTPGKQKPRRPISDAKS